MHADNTLSHDNNINSSPTEVGRWKMIWVRIIRSFIIFKDIYIFYKGGGRNYGGRGRYNLTSIGQVGLHLILSIKLQK